MKVVSVGGDVASFAGASGGHVFDGKFLVGGAGYMRLGRSYPGTQTTCEWGLLIVIPVAQCSEQVVNESGDFNGGLVVAGAPCAAIAYRSAWAVSSAGDQYLYDRAYLVFEPQIDVAVALAGPVVLAGSAGYRLIGSANGLEDPLKGMTASVSFRVHVR
jgi:hypothetical protein